MTPGERALRADVAAVERVPRAVFSVTGDEPLGYLHDVLAQDVASLTSGQGAIAAVLTAGGRVAAEVRVMVLAHAVLLDAEESVRPGVLEHVARHAPLAGIEVSDVSARFALSAVRGPRTDAALAEAELPLPGAADASFAATGELLVVRVAWGGPGVDLLGPAEAVAAALATLRTPRATQEELEAARIESGRPRYGTDVTEELLVNETPLLRHAVSLTKGCYPGQESVARVHNLGRARRALRGLRSTGPLVRDADVSLDGGVVGRITSAAAVPSGPNVAIALLREEIPAGATVKVGEVDAVVTELP